MHLPQIQLEALRPCWCEPGEFAVLDEDRVTALSSQAAAAGVALGMRRGGVATIAPSTTLLDRQSAKEDLARDAIMLALLQFTPEIARVGQTGAVMDVTASLRLFGGHVALCRQVTGLVTKLGFSIKLGTGPTALGAWLLATAPSRRGGRRRRTIKQTTLARTLDRLPCLLLNSAVPHAEWLDNIGCRTLGKLRALPRAGLLRRTTEALVAELDRAYGVLADVFEWVTPPPTFHVRVELMERIEHADAVVADTNRLVLQLIGWLAALKLAVTRLALGLEHERGRTAIPPTEIEVALAEPSWREDHLMRLLKEKLSRVELSGPVIAVYLKALQFVDMMPANESLFPEPGGTASDFMRKMELIVARLGKDNVLTHVRLAEHRPSAANGWMPVVEKRPKADALQESARRPFWILSKPIQLITRENRPFYGSPLKIIDGPEIIESGWWDDATEIRRYYVAQGIDGTCYWLFQDRSDDPTWHLHGFFA